MMSNEIYSCFGIIVWVMKEQERCLTWSGSSAEGQERSTWAGAQKHAKLSTCPFVSSSATSPRGSQIILLTPRFSHRTCSICSLLRLGFLFLWSRHSSVVSSVLHRTQVMNFDIRARLVDNKMQEGSCKEKALMKLETQSCQSPALYMKSHSQFLISRQLPDKHEYGLASTFL